MSKNKKPATPPPSTVLVLTLQTNGTGTLLTRRGELASLSSFTYQDLAGIVSAIEHGAAHLLDVEKHPPKDVPYTAASSSPTPSAPVETPESPAANDGELAQEIALDDTHPPTAEVSVVPDAPADPALPSPLNLHKPLVGITPEPDQLSLF